MIEDPKGGDLFIVDNSISGWTGLRYLTEWTELARSFDVATGYFEIGGLLAMEEKWQQLDKIRILMGDETTARSKRAILEAVRSNAKARLDDSLEAEKSERPFLEGVAAIEAALRDGRIECRVLQQGQVSRQGIRHPCQGRCDRRSGAGRLEQLHAARPD